MQATIKRGRAFVPISQVCQWCRSNPETQPLRSRIICQRIHRSLNDGTFANGRRSFHSKPGLRDEYKSEANVHPLGDFYADLLAKPIPKASTAQSELPTFVDTGGDATKEERAAKLFGNIKGSGYERKTSQTPDATWRTINGVPIPPRPEEPENCCMSGCVHCVWDDFRDDVESWAVRLREAQAKSVGESHKTTPKIDMARSEVAKASTSMDDDGGGSESLWTTPSTIAGTDDDLFEGIPVGIREFMATEKRIRDRQKAKKAKA